MCTPSGRCILPILQFFGNRFCRIEYISVILALSVILLDFRANLGTCEAAPPEKPKIFVGYINKDPGRPPAILVSILEDLLPQLGGFAPRTVAQLPADWSIPNYWKKLGGEGYTHFIVGGADAVTELQNRYKQPSWIVGKIARDQGANPHLTYYGL